MNRLWSYYRHIDHRANLLASWGIGQLYFAIWLWLVPQKVILKVCLAFIAAEVVLALIVWVGFRRYRTSSSALLPAEMEVTKNERIFLSLLEPIALALMVVFGLFGSTMRTYMLSTASLSGRHSAVNILLDFNTDPNRIEFGVTPLMVASASGNASVVVTLLAHGANVTEKSSGGITALSLAVSHGHNEIASLLRNAGAK
jgi:hypothetical protein